MITTIDRSPLLAQLIPLLLTVVIMIGLVGGLYALLAILNVLPFGEPILLVIRPVDVLVGMTIYLKTAIDFAIFMGRLMAVYPGWRNRVALEIGTALGNTLGTMIVIVLWTVFRNIDWLLALMVFLASLVLFELAHGGMEHIAHWEGNGGIKRWLYTVTHKLLDAVLILAGPILRRILPDIGSKLKGVEGLTWTGLAALSFSVPFILGLDDFAGYVPLFNVVNLFGFSVGVVAAHTVLNVALFLSPSVTIRTVKNEYVSFFGTLAFIGLALYGLVEVVKILGHSFGIGG